MVRRQSSSVVEEKDKKDEKDEGFEQLKEILVGDTADMIVESIDYLKLQARILEVLVHTLNKGDAMIFEDKNIVDNALNLWAGLLQSQPNLFDEFTKMKDAKKILIDGLLHCKAELVREQFKALLSNISKGRKHANKLQYVVNFLLEHISQLSGKPSRQYLGLTVEILNEMSLKSKLSPQEIAKMFDPDNMLFEVIQMMTQENYTVAEIRARSKSGEYNAQETAAKMEQSEEFLLGLMFLAGQILEAFDSG